MFTGVLNARMSAVLTPRPPPPKPARAKATARNITGLIFGGLVGAACGFFGVKYGLDLLLPVGEARWLKLTSLLTLPLDWLVVVGLHELGHLAGGWLVGGRFLLWVTGPLMVQRTPGGIRWALNRSVNLSGGMSACLPLEARLMTPRRAAVMILGGPLSSLALALMMLWAAAWLGARPGVVPAGWAVLQHFTLITAWVAGFIFLVTAWPFSAGGFKSDGKRVVDLLRGDWRSDQEAALLMLTTAGLAGERPADHDRTMVARAGSLRDGSLFDLYGHLLVYYHAADRGDWLRAQACLDHVLAGEDQVIAYVRDVVRCEYAWLLATRAQDASLARAWLETAGKIDFDPATRLRAEAAVLLAEGRNADAAAKAREGMRALETKSLAPVRSAFAADALGAILSSAG
jgi:hypothetical protein